MKNPVKWTSSDTCFSFTAWIHCSTCNRCTLPDHSCAGPRDGCFICGALDHKRSNCPNIGTFKRANKLVEFFYFLEKRKIAGVKLSRSNLQKCKAFRGLGSAKSFLSPLCVIYVDCRGGGGTLRPVKNMLQRAQAWQVRHKMPKPQEEVANFTSPMVQTKL